MDQRTFLSRLAVLAKQCEFDLTPDLIAFYDKLFMGIGYERGAFALEQVILNRRSRDPFPSIADLRRIALREADDTDLAIEASNRIMEAVAKFGGVNADLSAPQAKEFMGDIGWYVVQRNGGFVQVCELLRGDAISVFKAQFRELALSAIRRYKLGVLDVTPTFGALPKFQTSPALKGLVDKTVKQIGGTHANDPAKTKTPTR